MADKISGKGGAIFQSEDITATIADATALGDIVSWELSITGDTVETSAFSKTEAETSAKGFAPALYGWDVNANGVMAKEEPVVSVNTKYRLLMREANHSSTTTADYMFWTGIGICTGNTEGMVVNGEATRNYTFQGTGEVSVTYSPTLTFI
jgi:hypothetical protein